MFVKGSEVSEDGFHTKLCKLLSSDRFHPGRNVQIKDEGWKPKFLVKSHKIGNVLDSLCEPLFPIFFQEQDGLLDCSLVKVEKNMGRKQQEKKVTPNRTIEK